MSRVIHRISCMIYDIGNAFSGTYDTRSEYIRAAKDEIYRSVTTPSGKWMDKHNLQNDFAKTSLYFHAAFLKYKESKQKDEVLVDE